MLNCNIRRIRLGAPSGLFDFPYVSRGFAWNVSTVRKNILVLSGNRNTNEKEIMASEADLEEGEICSDGECSDEVIAFT